MNGLRVAIVTRRFWPLAGSSERMLAELGSELFHQGIRPSILTARFDARWPARVVFRQFNVHRLAFPQRFGWGTIRYMIALSRWLRRHLSSIDLVYVAQISLEAYSTIGALAGSGIPVVVGAHRDESWGSSENEDHRVAASRVLQRCREADALAATSVAVAARLGELGFSPQQIRHVRLAMPLRPPRTERRRLQSRAALAGVNDDLGVGREMPVVCCVGALRHEEPFYLLIDAWSIVAKHYPHARLWLIGDGPKRESIYQRIRERELVGRVLMPGTFDDLCDVMQASDLLVAPPGLEDQSAVVLESMGSNLPVLAASEVVDDNLIKDGVTGRCHEIQDPALLAHEILSSLAQPQQNLSLARAARRRVEQQHAIAEIAADYRHLFTQLVRASQRTAP